MTEYGYPFNGVNTSETQFSNLFRRLKRHGVSGVVGDTNLKLTQGSGLTTSLSAGFALARGFLYENDAAKNIVFTNGHATLSRRDWVVIHVDPTANTITAVVKEGVAQAGAPGTQPDPVIEQTNAGNYDLPIWEVYRAAGSTNVVTADISDIRQFMGKEVGQWTTAKRPVGAIGEFGFNVTLGKLEFWDPTLADWVAVVSGTIAPSLLSSAVPISKGGTGATTRDLARKALGFYVQNTAMNSVDNVDGDIRLW